MNVIILPPGRAEPEGEDYLKINRLPDGRFQFHGCVRFNAAAVDPNANTHTGAAFHISEPFGSSAFAEAVGAEWAREHGAERVYVLPFVRH